MKYAIVLIEFGDIDAIFFLFIVFNFVSSHSVCQVELTKQNLISAYPAIDLKSKLLFKVT